MANVFGNPLKIVYTISTITPLGVFRFSRSLIPNVLKLQNLKQRIQPGRRELQKVGAFLFRKIFVVAESESNIRIAK